VSEFDKEIGLNYLRGMYLSDLQAAPSRYLKKDLHQNIGLGRLGIATFQHILQDPRTQNIPLIVATPGFKRQKVIWSKEIGVLQALSSTPPANKSEEDLQSLVHEIRSAVEEARTTKAKSGNKKRVGKTTKLTDNDSKSAESFQTRQNEPELSAEPELPVERESPANLRRRIWQNYFI